MADNSNKIILDLCGGTGAWSKPYKDAGYNVELITLPEYDVTRVEFREHAMHFERMDLYYHDDLTVLYEDIYGIFAAPPCTEFSLAKNTSPRDLEGGMEIVKACMNIIWNCRLHGKPQFWAMENPVGFLRQFLGVPYYTFEQWQFGGNKIKRTDIWGYFREPKPTVKNKPHDLVRLLPNNHTNAKNWTTCTEDVPEWYDGPKLDRAARRAITPAGFAQAFYRANQ